MLASRGLRIRILLVQVKPTRASIPSFMHGRWRSQKSSEEPSLCLLKVASRVLNELSHYPAVRILYSDSRLDLHVCTDSAKDIDHQSARGLAINPVHHQLSKHIYRHQVSQDP